MLMLPELIVLFLYYKSLHVPLNPMTHVKLNKLWNSKSALDPKELCQSRLSASAARLCFTECIASQLESACRALAREQIVQPRFTSLPVINI